MLRCRLGRSGRLGRPGRPSPSDDGLMTQENAQYPDMGGQVDELQIKKLGQPLAPGVTTKFAFGVSETETYRDFFYPAKVS